MGADSNGQLDWDGQIQAARFYQNRALTSLEVRDSRGAGPDVDATPPALTNVHTDLQLNDLTVTFHLERGRRLHVRHLAERDARAGQLHGRRLRGNGDRRASATCSFRAFRSAFSTCTAKCWTGPLHPNAAHETLGAFDTVHRGRSLPGPGVHVRGAADDSGAAVRGGPGPSARRQHAGRAGRWTWPARRRGRSCSLTLGTP